RDSIIRWHFRTFSTKRAQIDEWVADPSGPPVVRLRSPAETERWLEAFGAPTA
ncbi:MAG TPA: adenylate kinase, partial [Acidimicrobiaceae bacterium]|nr:adenylate kinase [Acidimicrobiaceae bacterium]